MRLTATAPGKVNLCLFVGESRTHGRHELVTLFESVSLADEVHLVVKDSGADEVHCPGVLGPNLAERALDELRLVGWDAPPVRVEIDKRVPVAAGMGGGSADAAAVLRLATELAPGRPEELARIAARLGADVPAQLVPGLAVGTGVGDLVEPFEPLAAHALLVLPASEPLSTRNVYERADALGLPRSARELETCYHKLLRAPAPGSRPSAELLINDLASAAAALHPPIEPALDAARDAGADHWLVCGSGPTVIGVFWGADGEDRSARAAAALRDRYPDASAAVPVEADFGMPRIA
jgi:4-diphosphocytidyl-2-C-methyl-D-erythritol kinase